MNYLHLHRPEEALKTYRELLGYTKVSLLPERPHRTLLTSIQSDVTRNYAEKSINNILDYVGGEGKVGLTSAGTIDPPGLPLTWLSTLL